MSRRRKAMSMNEISILRNMHDDSNSTIVLPIKAADILPRNYDTNTYYDGNGICIAFDANGSIIKAKTNNTRRIGLLYERLLLIQNRLKRVKAISNLLRETSHHYDVSNNDIDFNNKEDKLVYVLDKEEKLLIICCEYLESYIYAIISNHIEA